MSGRSRDLCSGRLEHLSVRSKAGSMGLGGGLGGRGRGGLAGWLGGGIDLMME